MSLFKCKICGGDLEIIEGQSVANCEYCGNPQTIKSRFSENIDNMFQRANALRLRCDFDKAEKMYEKIIQEEPKNDEAYWGIILCRYGIVYVDDPLTGKKIPTCNRVSNESVVADEDYKLALQYSDVLQRGFYEQQAKEFDRIQKEILAISSNEEPFDVFICYKEKDEHGKRTHDSVIANEIYHELISQGFKVFYAAITLEDKLGQSYEPIIFAALNSSKVMIVLGTKPEYFNAVWVKNEWSRYLNLIKKGEKKVLIPAYKGMDAYDLPEEFAHLQAQDMSKIGFIQDLIRGIKKVVVKEEKIVAPVSTQSVNTNNSNIQNLLKRVAAFLRESNWQDANTYCERILDIEMENAEAHLYKLFVELRIQQLEDLSYKSDIGIINKIKASYNYRNVITFGNNEIIERINKVINDIQSNAYEAEYKNAIRLYVSNNIDDLRKARQIFSHIIDYKRSEDYVEQIDKKIEEIKKTEAEAQALAKERELENKYNRAINLYENNELINVKSALEIFKEIISYKDANEYKEKCVVKIVELQKEKDYETAKSYSTSNSTSNLRIAISTFEKLGDYLDSKQMLEICKRRYPSVLQEEEYMQALQYMIKPNLEAYDKAIALFEKNLDYKDSKEKHKECLKYRKQLANHIKKSNSFLGKMSNDFKELTPFGKLIYMWMFPVIFMINIIVYFINKKN